MKVLIAPPGAVSARQRKALLADGVHVIESSSPDQFRLLSPEPELVSSSVLLRAALGALNSGTGLASDQREAFTRLVAKFVKEDPGTPAAEGRG